MLTSTFQKSPFCESSACVEVALDPDLAIAGTGAARAWEDKTGNWYLTNTLPGAPVQAYTKQEWIAFLKGAKAGAFDLP